MPMNAPKAIICKTGTISSTAKGLVDTEFGFTAAQIDAASRARISVDTQPARYTYDGVTTPTANVGHIAPVNVTFFIEGNLNLQKLKFIRQGGSDAIVSVTLESI